ncbi:MAG: hypothetical protein LBI92_04165 [Azoarcus sp.]|jgi:hypothetical protein|nr:hypothetical protein [Azoarcus sp.]
MNEKEHSGILHHLTADDLAHLTQLLNSKQVAEAWAYLASKGDAYAVLASDVVKDEPESLVGQLFHRMVELQWENTLGSSIYQSQTFQEVAAKHLENYIVFLAQPEHDWPTTYFIEGSYKRALEDSGLIPITAIDGLFSVMQYHTDVPLSWANAMDWGNLLMGSDVRWEEERIALKSDIFINDITLDEAVEQFAANLFDLPPDLITHIAIPEFLVGNFGLYIEPVTTLGPDTTDFSKIGQALIMLTLFQKFGGDVNATDVHDMLEGLASGSGEPLTNELAVEKLSAALGIAVSPITNDVQLKDAIGNLRIYLNSHTGIDLKNLTKSSTSELVDIATQDSSTGLAHAAFSK